MNIQKTPSTLYVVADGGHARFLLRPDAHSHLKPVGAMEAVHLHDPSRNLGRDRPGRTQESATMARHAIEPRTDPHEAEKKGFHTLVGETIEQSWRRGEFDRLVIVAQAPALQGIRDALDKSLQKVIAEEIRKDLTGKPVHELESVLPRVLRYKT
ncbi:MAG: host attachment protein [Pseudomonadota bacterium]|nr:host attachment protein [Pseudomonadota bacterium]